MAAVREAVCMSMSGEGMGRRLGRMAIMGMDQKIVFDAAAFL